MTIKTTRFSPDTCQCVLEYQWDDTLSETNRTHTLSNYVSKCPAHSGLSDTNGWNAVFDENPRKNIARQLCLDNGPTGLFDLIDGARQLKQNITFNFSWSGVAPDRVLTISFTGINLTTNQKNTIQTALNTRFGVGRVIIA
jgi:hypothetical protein